MPRRRSGRVLLRCDAESFHVVDLAREGLLQQHSQAAGFVFPRSGRDKEITGFVPVSSVIGELEGKLILHTPRRVEVAVSGWVVTSPKGGRKIEWLFQCRCGQACRAFFRPLEDSNAAWKCRKCWGLRYPNSRELNMIERRRERAFRGELTKIRNECDRLLKLPGLLGNPRPKPPPKHPHSA